MFEQVMLYFSLFIMAATPWLEILIVIPIGVGLGLHPILVAIVTFIGNALPVFLIVFLYDRFNQWRQARKEAKKIKQECYAGVMNPVQQNTLVNQNEGGSKLNGSNEPPQKRSRRKEKARKILKDYGVPGLAMLGLLVTGIHLAVIIALTIRPSKFSLLFWMNTSLVIWTVIITIASVYSIEWLLSIIPGQVTFFIK